MKKEKILKIAITVLIIGIVIGVPLIAAGMLKINSLSENNNKNVTVEDDMTSSEIDL